MDEKEVRYNLALAKEISENERLYDLHVHPFEIVFGGTGVLEGTNQEGVYCCRKAVEYCEPCLSGMSLESRHSAVHFDSKNRLALQLAMSQLYCHTGPGVLGAQMRLAGLDCAMLLPVAQANGSVDTQMQAMFDMFGSDDRFLLSGCIPSRLPKDQIDAHVVAQKKAFHLSAIKLHPNISEIPVGQSQGRERVDATLETCGRNRLALVVHGGRSPFLAHQPARKHGHMTHYQNIDWGISTAPVVIAHAGCFGCASDEIRDVVLPVLKSLLARHSNLFVDISGVDYSSLQQLLKEVDTQRMIFGSDALYGSMWKTMVKLMCALREVGMDIGKELIQIANLTPQYALKLKGST